MAVEVVRKLVHSATAELTLDSAINNLMIFVAVFSAALANVLGVIFNAASCALINMLKSRSLANEFSRAFSFEAIFSALAFEAYLAFIDLFYIVAIMAMLGAAFAAVYVAIVTVENFVLNWRYEAANVQAMAKIGCDLEVVFRIAVLWVLFAKLAETYE